MLLSICITSYNRPSELKRCLDSIRCSFHNQIEINISEDCSPQKEKISEIVDKYKRESIFKVNYNCNDFNLGYDGNFKKLIDVSTGKYLLFLTDDDSFSSSDSLDLLVSEILNKDFSVGFTPYFDCINLRYERRYKKSFEIAAGLNSVNNYFYSSILLSGLIFQKDKIPNYDPIRFKDLIYSQVYVFCFLLLNNKGYYFDIPIINYNGDGKNSFGTNEASEKNTLMANRLSYLSNLEFHKRLVKTVKFIDSDCNVDLLKGFSKEYSLKSYTGMLYARRFGRVALKEYWKKMSSLDIRLSKICYLYYYSLYFLGSKISEFLMTTPRFLLLRYRSSIIRFK